MNITYNLNKTVLTRTDKNIITYNIDEPINVTITYDDSFYDWFKVNYIKR